jgi:Family of unknown function (DUF6204)
MGDPHIFRVTVRGRFVELGESQRRHLLEALDDHHVTKAAYTGEGTFTYDSSLYAFSLRYEIRTDGDHPGESAAASGLSQAESFLRTLGFGFDHLKVTTTDMRSMWADAAKRQAPKSLTVLLESRPDDCTGDSGRGRCGLQILE